MDALAERCGRVEALPRGRIGTETEERLAERINAMPHAYALIAGGSALETDSSEMTACHNRMLDAMIQRSMLEHPGPLVGSASWVVRTAAPEFLLLETPGRLVGLHQGLG